ncbi:hypothetical protein LOTGIDRAFT_115110 [Lottia gigantea]|uniref:CHCH domain-containing protein n=1 Tax=Lottia gigantea TaxID=225164 RepID=V4A0A9_LOTGI|nr:hypothetical protein LOTGIDRAFT_115110 [Lottia gigantea]ESO97248.1 hypothetical protein LOTGIDRAFT_115110 [Lottia gigantea]
MGQMAATAGGVAIGSAVGHTVGHALTGGFGGGGQQEVAQDQAPAQQQQQQQRNPCQMEFESFVQCAQNQGDISLCQGFNAALKECKLQYGR